MHNLVLSRFHVKLWIQCTSIYFIRFFYAPWIKSFHQRYTVQFWLLRICLKLRIDNDYFLIQSRNIPNFYLINQWNDIYMNLKMCKLISSLTSLLCHFSLSTMTFKAKKAKEKTTVFWALRSRLCINFPLFVCVIFKIFHMLKYFSFLHYYHSIFFRK